MRNKLYSLFETDAGYSDGFWNEFPLIMGTTADLDINSEPANYILLRWDISNNTQIFGDGKTLERYSDCDIILTCDGAYSQLIESSELKIEKILNDNEIIYRKFSLGFIKDLNKTQVTYAVVMRD